MLAAFCVCAFGWWLTALYSACVGCCTHQWREREKEKFMWPSYDTSKFARVMNRGARRAAKRIDTLASIPGLLMSIFYWRGPRKGVRRCVWRLLLRPCSTQSFKCVTPSTPDHMPTVVHKTQPRGKIWREVACLASSSKCSITARQHSARLDGTFACSGKQQRRIRHFFNLPSKSW